MTQEIEPSAERRNHLTYFEGNIRVVAFRLP